MKRVVAEFVYQREKCKKITGLKDSPVRNVRMSQISITAPLADVIENVEKFSTS